MSSISFGIVFKSLQISSHVTALQYLDILLHMWLAPKDIVMSRFMLGIFVHILRSAVCLLGGCV